MSTDTTSRFRPITRTSLIEVLRRRLQEDILSGRYPTGTTLPPERELAAQYGVTRTSLRHALIELRGLGLIAIRHGIGSIVEDVAARAGADVLQHMALREGGWDLRLLGDLLGARALIGGLFARVAAERRADGDIADLEEVVCEASRSREDAERLQFHENHFMRRVTVATHIRTFMFLANSITAVYAGTLERFRSAFGDGDWVVGSLERILAAVREHDALTASVEMERYLGESGSRMMTALGAQP